MKKIVFSIMLAFIIGGCGYSNWNVFNSPQTQNSRQNSQQTNTNQNGQISQTIEQNQGLIVLEEPMPQQQNDFENPNKPEAKKDGNFHINTIVSTWGKPTRVKIDDFDQKNYIWQNCKGSGDSKQCCERVLITDNEGYVTNLREAISECL